MKKMKFEFLNNETFWRSIKFSNYKLIRSYDYKLNPFELSYKIVSLNII